MDPSRKCFEHVETSFGVLKVGLKAPEWRVHVTQMARCLTLLREYIAQCDDAHKGERMILPHGKSSLGKHIILTVRFPLLSGRQEDLEVSTHANESLGALRRKIMLLYGKRKFGGIKIDLFLNGEVVSPVEDRRLMHQISIRERAVVLSAKIRYKRHGSPSQDSSSDSSTNSSPTLCESTSRSEEELPGVIMSRDPKYCLLLLRICQLGSQLNASVLRDRARELLDLIPSNQKIIKKILLFKNEGGFRQLEKMCFQLHPVSILYHLEVLQSLLLPATLSPDDEQSDSFKLWFIDNGGIRLLLKLLESPDFVKESDVNTRNSIYHVTIRLLRLFLASLGMVQTFHCAKELTSESPTACGRVEQLREALLHLPSIHSDLLLRKIVNWIGQSASKTVLDDVNLVTLETVYVIQRFAWSAAAGAAHLAKASVDAIHKAMESKPIDSESASLCKESLEVLSTLLALQPNLHESLIKERHWQTFIIDLLLMSSNRPLRLTVCDQLFLMVTRCSTTPNPLRFLLTLLFTNLSTVVSENERSSSEYFALLCKLLSNVRQTKGFAFDAYHKLKLEVEWLKKVKADFQSSRGCTTVIDTLLEGRLKIAKELLQFQPEEVKCRLGSEEKGGENLVQELVEEFLCPASKQLCLYKKGVYELARSFIKDCSSFCENLFAAPLPSESIEAICSSHSTQLAAYDVLVVLCCNCIPNMERLCQLQDELFFPEHEMTLGEWEYMPPINARPIGGFVGLKNGGATGYMNCILQMLFMISSVRDGIVKVKGLWKEGEEEEPTFFEEDSQRLTEKVRNNYERSENGGKSAYNIKAYRLGVVKQVQCLFGHLMKSRLQYYTPRGFWKSFRMGDRPVNVHEQQDAMQFFNDVVDCIDKGLKMLGHEEIVSKVLGGSFADQKICKGCPHRYAREENFMSLSVDIRYRGHLLESLEEYVKGDLLEGDNAYFCEKCNRRVDTVKRMCFKSLPPVLMIQLKRFGYDWERDCAIKFNDYMEVPRELDMEPYTVDGLAKIESERIGVSSDDESDDGFERDKKNDQCTKYSLAGVVIRSGQASGGQYYSFIKQRLGEKEAKWYKFEDGEVSEAKLEDDEELKAQCCGGEFVGETYDHVTKRMQYRRQKRWWNAYLLFYERVDSPSTEAVSNDAGQLPVLPRAIERGIAKENLEFMHLKALYSIEYFRFMRSLVDSVAPLIVVEPMKETQEKLIMLVLNLLTNFLLSYGLRTKKLIRGLACEWVNSLLSLLKCSKYMRFLFATSALFRHPERFVEYLLECPNQEVRTAFSRLLANLAYFSHNDGPYVNHSPVYGPASSDVIGAPMSREDQTLSDCIIVAVLNLLKKEVGEHERHISQYFYFFLTYCSFSHAERSQLLKMRVPALFIALALGEGPALIGYRHHATDLSRLYSVVSVLVRCYDVSRHMAHCVKEAEPAPNPFYELSQPEAMHPEIVEALFENPKYLKKVISENAAAEDTLQLFQFLCWENPSISRMVLTELLYQITCAYAYELRPYLDLLYCMLMLDDSLQHDRLLNCVRGFQEDQLDGILDIIRRSTNNQPKRSYQCIKMLVNLFTTSRVANELLKDESIYRPFKASVDWLGDELDKRPYGHSYSYNKWSPPAQSNESSNGYFLERSNSARETLTKAYDLLPEDEEDEAEPMVDDDVSESESLTGALEGTVPEIMSQYHLGGTSSGADQSEPDQSSPERVTWARDKSRIRVEFSQPTKTDSIASDSPRPVRFDKGIGELGTSHDSNDKNYVERSNNAAQTLSKAYDLLSEDIEKTEEKEKSSSTENKTSSEIIRSLQRQIEEERATARLNESNFTEKFHSYEQLFRDLKEEKSRLLLEHKEKMDQFQKDSRSLRARSARAESDLKNLSGRYTQLEQESARSESDLKKLSGRYTQLEQESARSESDLKKLSGRFTQLEQESARAESDLRKASERYVQLEQESAQAKSDLRKVSARCAQLEQENKRASERFVQVERRLRKELSIANQRRDKDVALIRQELASVRSEACEAQRRLELQKDEVISSLRNELTSVKCSYQEEMAIALTRCETMEASRNEMKSRLDEFTDVLSINPDELHLLDQKLGSGAFAGVIVGQWRGMSVAVKKIHDLIASPRNVAMFKREVSVCSRLHHPNIMIVCGAVMAEGSPLQIVMELLEGSVGEVIDAAHASGSYLTVYEQLSITMDMASGISYLHQIRPLPYVHGDIRPSNVLVTRDMKVKVGDLGSAHIIESSLSAGPMSPSYVAPERSRTSSTLASDVYSFGVSLIEIFTGVGPIPEERQTQLAVLAPRSHLFMLCSRLIRQEPADRMSAQRCFETLKATVAENRSILPSREIDAAKRLVQGIFEGTMHKVSLVNVSFT
ncbi:ubiquitin carboxyl-terminal hydrolase 9X-like isoform X2 [Oscarella lobularis]|uniref:ubiquitin carboxyl-terminal hydrolase 9X-like isoform X2 n=1 Tax=Oscarella lobularis TaxID=121494 RepID=UPI003313E5A4